MIAGEGFRGNCVAAACAPRRARVQLERTNISARAGPAEQLHLAAIVECRPGSSPGVAPPDSTRVAAGSEASAGSSLPDIRPPLAAPEWFRRFLEGAQVGKR